MAILNYAKFNSFVQALGEEKHNLASDQLKVFLTNSAPSASNTVLSNITEISYANVSSRNISTTSWSNSSGISKLVLADLTLTASGSVGPFRYVGVYNDTAPNDELVFFGDIGSSVTMASGETYLVDFDGVSGALTIG
jgi:hypothetical protein